MWETKNGLTVQQLLTGRSNVFLVSDHNASLLVDTSWRPARSRLQAALDGLGFHNDRQLTALFITHAHFDHAANAAWVRERYQLQLIIQQTEADFLRGGLNSPTADATAFTRLLFSRFSRPFKSYLYYSPAAPDITFAGRLDLHDLGFDAYLLHTPGHSIGSSSLIVSDEIAVVGDTMHGVFPNSAFPPFAADNHLLLESWKKLLNTDCQIFLPSHGKVVDRELVERDFSKRLATHA